MFQKTYLNASETHSKKWKQKPLSEALLVERALDQEEFSEICQFHDL